VVSCGLRPQFLARWCLDVLSLFVGSLATSWLQGGRNLAPPPSSPVLKQSLAPEEGKGSRCYFFACIHHFCLGFTDSLTSHTCTDLETDSLVYFLGSFIDATNQQKPEN
jgi:hypothetical protein